RQKHTHGAVQMGRQVEGGKAFRRTIAAPCCGGFRHGKPVIRYVPGRLRATDPGVRTRGGVVCWSLATRESVRVNSTLALGHIQGGAIPGLSENLAISCIDARLLRLGHMQWNSEFGRGQQGRRMDTRIPWLSSPHCPAYSFRTNLALYPCQAEKPAFVGW